MNPSALAAVLTAAGRSSRMGKLKALLDWQGRPLIAHQVDTLLPCREVVVVLGHEAAVIRPAIPVAPHVRVVLNPEFETGRAGTLMCGVAAVTPGCEGVLLLAVDQPLRWEVVTAMCAGFSAAAAIAVPTHLGRRGHPVLVRNHLLPALMELHTEPEGLRSWLRRWDSLVQEIPVELPEVRWNLNTPADYARLREAL